VAKVFGFGIADWEAPWQPIMGITPTLREPFGNFIAIFR
jgi:hypothetical protein